jgi:hypothetical protein
VKGGSRKRGGYEWVLVRAIAGATCSATAVSVPWLICAAVHSSHRGHRSPVHRQAHASAQARSDDYLLEPELQVELATGLLSSVTSRLDHLALARQLELALHWTRFHQTREWHGPGGCPWEPSWEPFSVDSYGRPWTPVTRKLVVPAPVDTPGRPWTPLGDLGLRRLGVRVAPGALQQVPSRQGRPASFAPGVADRHLLKLGPKSRWPALVGFAG